MGKTDAKVTQTHSIEEAEVRSKLKSNLGRQSLPAGRLLLWLIVSLISFGPLAVGVFPIVPGFIGPVLVLVLSVSAFNRSTRTRAYFNYSLTSGPSSAETN